MSALQLDPWEWFFALFAAFVLGLSKAGIKGIAVIIITILALLFGAKASTGILVPMLIVGDVFAVWYYKKHVRWKYFLLLFPWMVIGVLLGVWFGKDLPDAVFKNGMAIIILISVGMMAWLDLQRLGYVPNSRFLGISMGLAAGFTTMVGNLAGAFSNVFFLSMRLPKNDFIGTAAWVFFFINWLKIPFHIFAWGTITKETLYLNLSLLPGILVGLFVGIRIVKRIQEKMFRKLILILTAIGAVLIFFR